MNSTLSSLGYSSKVKSAYYSHVLTQSSVQGTFVTRNGIVVRQGFKQGLLSRFSIFKKQAIPITSASKLKDSVQLIVFPNPFVDKITLRFQTVNVTPTYVTLYDLTGNIVFQNEYPANLQEFTLDNLGHLRIEKHFVRVQQNNQTKTIPLLKN